MTYWLSFAGEEGFRGVVLVDADNFYQAVLETHRAGVNPGGQIAGWPYCNDDHEREVSAKLPRLKLLSKEDIKAAGEMGMSIKEAEQFMDLRVKH